MREEQYRFTFCNETKLYKRVTKPEAKKFYCSGTDVVLLPCNMNGESPWAAPYIINVYDENKQNKKDNKINLRLWLIENWNLFPFMIGECSPSRDQV